MPHEFAVASFNVENLNTVGTRFGERDQQVYDAPSFEAKTKFVADVLDRIGQPCIVGFQEIFDEAAMEACVRRSTSSAANLAVPMSKVTTNPATGARVADGPNVGLLTTFPIRSLRAISEFPAEIDMRVPLGPHGEAGRVVTFDIRGFERPVIRAELDVPGLPGLTVLVSHLKSKRPNFLKSEDENAPLAKDLGSVRSLLVRACEAAALRALIRQIRAERAVDGRRRPLIVLGDVNDDIDSVTTRLLEGSRPFARGGSGTASRYDFATSTADLMLNAIELSPPADGVTYSHVFDGVGSLIDMIFLSADFYGVEKRQRAEIVSTRIEVQHLDEKPANSIILPPVEAFEPPKPSPPKDPLDDIREQKEKPPKKGGVSVKSDHGVPIARLRVW